MKAGHAAALALVGWYLMIPPLVRNEKWCVPLHVDDKKPLSAWQRYRSFDSDQACEAGKRQEIKRLQDASAQALKAAPDGGRECGDRTPAKHTVISDVAHYAAAAESLCISTDDPRLKAN